MARKGRYYLGRVIKQGLLNQTKLMDAIVNSPTLKVGKFTWTITNVLDARNGNLPYVFGHLAKFSVEGHVTVVDTTTRSEVDSPAPNLLVASAPFVYLPNYSGIAYLHVWNDLQEELFPLRFKALIEAAHEEFFVNCSVEPITDYRAFSRQLSQIRRVTNISATVSPPNPLFGRLWGPLRDYIKVRNAAEVSVRETQNGPSGLRTEIVSLVEQILRDRNAIPKTLPSFADAALLMAADGYGRGKIAGTRDDTEIVVYTSDSQKSFSFTREPNPEELARLADEQFSRISAERDMTHDEEDS